MNRGNELPGFARRTFSFDWSRAEPLHALLCLPAVVLPLLIGPRLGYPGTGVLMAGGAMCVGFGSFQKPLFWRWGPMLAGAVGIAISGGLGATVHQRIVPYAVLITLWTFLYGLSNAMGPAAGWVGLQCCVFMVISAAAPPSLGGPRGAVMLGLGRGAGLLAGGLLQMLVVVLLWRFVPRSPPTLTDPDFDPARVHPRSLIEEVTKRSAWYRFALQMAVTAVIAVVAFYYAGFNNAYWIPMTALLLPRPEFVDTTARAVLRLCGTLAGGALCTVLIVFAHPAGEVLALLVAVFLYLAYCLTNVNYGAFALAITGYIVFILAMVRLPERATIAHRIEATLIGGVIALAVHGVFLLWRRGEGGAPGHQADSST